MAYATVLLALAIALSPGPATVAKTGTAETAGDVAASPKPQETKYCIQVQAFTGSRIGKTECKTRAQWSKEGVDLDHPDKS
jgi:hypothetical protein